VDPQVLQRVKNSVEAEYPPEPRGMGHRGTLARMETAYRWQPHRGAVQQRMAVTAADLMRGREAVLTRDNTLTGVMERGR